MITGESDISRDAVLAHLESMLENRRFASAERNKRFLRYVVERTLDGKADEIKETVIATEVYGRTASYDPKKDSIVRVEATRLRQKLRSYYEEEGREAPVRIHIPGGTYVPRFEKAAMMEAQPPAAADQAPVEKPIQNARREPFAWAGIAASLILLVSIPLVKASRAAAGPTAEAIAAWKEGVALLGQDPHSGDENRGAPPTLLRAIERLEFAVARGPGIAPAWATLAEAYDYVFPYVGRNPHDDARRAEEAAQQAVALDDQFSGGHHMLALVRWLMKWDFKAADKSYRRALELDPRNIYAAVEYADLLRETGRTTEAAELIRRSRALLPALPQLAVKEAEIQLDLGRPAAAIASANDALHLKRDSERAWLALAMAEEAAGNTPSALAHYEHVLTLNPSDRHALPAYGYLLARSGQRQHAAEVAQRLEQINTHVRNCAFQIAVVYEGLGDHDRALDWLERAWRTRQMLVPFAAVEPRFGQLRQSPRFRELLSRLGLQPV